MELKELLLERLQSRRNWESGAHFLSSHSKLEKCRYVVNLIEETVMPRLITLSGANILLQLLSANKCLYGITCAIDGNEVVKIDFSGSGHEMFSQRKLLSSLTDFLGQMEIHDVGFKEVDLGDKAGAGVLPGALIPASEDSRPIAHSIQQGNIQQFPKNKVAAVEILNDLEGKSSIPEVFLTEANRAARDMRQFVIEANDEVQSIAATETDLNENEFAGINELYTKFAPVLGREMLFVVLAEGEENDAYSFALNDQEGIAVEMSRQDIGRICQSWSKAKSTSK